jgi:hypothetical protein
VSRSGYIYMITDFGTGAILHAFTVKYECAARAAKLNSHEITVSRIKDGHHHPDAKPIILDPVTMEPYVSQEEERS